MLTISVSDVPNWLKNSELYINLEKDEDNTIEIPKDFYKKTDNIFNIEDFEKVYRTCKFWNMDYPITFYKFALKNKKNCLKFFYSELDDKNDEINSLIDDLSYSSNLEYKIITYEIDYEINYKLIIKFSENFILSYNIHDNCDIQLLNSIINDNNYEENDGYKTIIKNEDFISYLEHNVSEISPNI